MSNTDNELADAKRWETAEDERHSARTDDGWNVALYRYRPNGPALGMPVILGHGLAGSRYIFDVHEDYSMARALAARGLDRVARGPARRQRLLARRRLEPVPTMDVRRLRVS